METLSKLLLLLQDLLLVLKSVAKGDILQAVLVYLLVFSLVGFLPLLDDFLGQFLASAAVDGVHGDRTLQFLELLLNLSALSLLLVQFVLKLTGHTVVTILSLLEIVANLMHVSESVQILVLMEHLIGVLLEVAIVMIHDNDLALAVFVDFLEFLVFAPFIFDGLDELTLHSGVARQVTHAAIVFVVLFAVFLELGIAAVLLGAHTEGLAALGG
mmetsp:Transcript_24306/g.30135  ORF Transcript_24306/g.30135 Transcript_24306/m.30135 type:complete len:214 (+) Transcript_24306:617-1258(+)